MRVVVLGAGIAGITAAWYLAAGGAEVTVIERGTEPASETSHANGGHISTQSGVPWTGPSGLRAFLTRRFNSAETIRLLHTRDPGRLDWYLRALSASRPSAYRRAAIALLKLAQFSRSLFDELVAEQNLDLCLEARGTLDLYRSRRAFARAHARRSKGVESLSPREILAREPALANAAVHPVGALYYPGDATGDCRRFCIQLGERARDAGVTFRYGESVRGLVVARDGCRGVATDGGTFEADACVVALGAWSASFLRRYGLRLPVLPLRGYTLTAPIGADAPAPGRFVDAERHIVGARLDTHFRAAGMADFMGLEAGNYDRRKAVLERIVREWYPALPRNGTEFWSCLRPITPDGPPILGASGIEGLWLNTGLGPLGWTLGCGAGQIVADLVLGKKPPIPLAGLTRTRFHRFG
ncbi:MAG: FAD-dependent oxidoreductase [Gammaproteobacteria bacterium]